MVVLLKKVPSIFKDLGSSRFAILFMLKLNLGLFSNLSLSMILFWSIESCIFGHSPLCLSADGMREIVPDVLTCSSLMSNSVPCGRSPFLDDNLLILRLFYIDMLRTCCR